MYIKNNINRPQYRFSIYWMKFFYREYLSIFEIADFELQLVEFIFIDREDKEGNNDLS